MPILSIQVNQVGQAGVAPNVIYLQTNDSLATVTTSGYLNLVAAQGIPLLDTTMALVSTKTSINAESSEVQWLEVIHSGGDWSLLAPTAGDVESVVGTTNEIDISPTTGDVIVALASNAILPGTGGVTLPGGDTAERAGGAGTIRFNSQTDVFEAYDGTSWATIETSTIGVVSVSGTAGEIDVSPNTGAVVVSIDPGYVGQTSITVLGAVATGSWFANPVDLAHGGTNANLTASNGGIFYSTASAGAILSGTATANQALLSGASSTPSWSTATYPATTTANQLLYSSSNNVIAGLATGNNGVLITSSGGAPSISSTLPLAVQANITETGTVTTGVWQGTPIDLAHGGTNAALTASNGGIFYSTGTAGAILAGTATASQVLLSGSTAAPAWSTATYPATTTINQILYSNANNTVTGLLSANNGVLITSGTAVPSISSTLPAAVQGNITAVSTIGTGVWQGTVIAPAYGGTGVNNGSSTFTIGGNTVFSGAFPFTGTLTASTSVIFPTSGTLSTTTGTVTSVSGTTDRITVTSPTTAPVIDIAATYVGQTSITVLGAVATGTWSANPVDLAHGGTNANLTASNGGIFYSTGSAGAILAGTAVANQILMSGSSTTPAWSTATYPATTTANEILYSSANNTVTGITSQNSAVLTSTTSKVPVWRALSNGGLIIGATGGNPLGGTLTAGTGISVTNGANSITIAATGGVLAWNSVAGTTQAAAVNNGYIIANASQTTVTLPTTAAIGSVVQVQGLGAGGWILAAGTGQTIQLGALATNTAGSFISANLYDVIQVVCIVANTTWSVSFVLSSGLTKT